MPSIGKLGPEHPIVFKNQNAWEAWMARHHGSSTGIWLRLRKSSADLRTVSYQEALDVALCYGWIDGRKRAHDDESWLQRFVPRGSRSIWSKINRSRAEGLVREGRMQPPGLAAMERAKQNGRWESAYDGQRTAAPPEDFVDMLNRRPRARAFFESLDSHNRYAVLFRIQNAKKPETRQRRIEKFVAMLERHEKLHP